ncbi:MAG: quinone oxidoreductase [Acidimicrobiaceae bacterium]|jgi:putative PIG3 family NAD(P)H quinone oxidoreductase|nr:quinone oxidoreductase [Acidimicrobiaceae bacterium]|tara:strand:- start:69793 stop:70767 length:975 start_codon:yes stop_codon:yes gene_type:complete
MRAVVLENYGGVEQLVIQEVPDPQPQAQELLIKVQTTALNRADILQRMGLYPAPPSQYEIPGLEFAGTVQEMGSKTTGFKIGDRVMGIVTTGSYAELLTVHYQQAMIIPKDLNFQEAAAIPEAWLTAFDALVDKGNLQKNQTCLIHAGASGVGTAAIQIAKRLKANVAITTSEKKIKTCVDLGADRAINYQQEDFVEVTKEWTKGKGVNVIIDLVGGGYLQRNVRAISTKGTIVQVGLMGSGKPELDLGTLLRKRITLIGTVLRTRSTEEKITLTQNFSELLLKDFKKQFRTVIDSAFAFEDIPEAHTRMENNLNTGKIIIEIS